MCKSKAKENILSHEVREASSPLSLRFSRFSSVGWFWLLRARELSVAFVAKLANFAFPLTPMEGSLGLLLWRAFLFFRLSHPHFLLLDSSIATVPDTRKFVWTEFRTLFFFEGSLSTLPNAATAAAADEATSETQGKSVRSQSCSNFPIPAANFTKKKSLSFLFPSSQEPLITNRRGKLLPTSSRGRSQRALS